MIDGFSQSVRRNLNHYVYLYIDPRDDSIFYVGKGTGDRAFDHLRDTKGSDKTERIKELRELGYEPKIEILVHGLESETALKVEASIIDLLGIKNLTNIQIGHHAKTHGRMTLEQIEAVYASEKADVDDSVLLVNLNQTYRYGMPAVKLYDATRSAWTLNTTRKECIKYAIAVYQGIAQEVYEVVGWFPNHSTFNTRQTTDDDRSRWEFVGKLAPEPIRQRYRYKDVSDYLGGQNPIRYLNC